MAWTRILLCFSLLALTQSGSGQEWKTLQARADSLGAKGDQAGAIAAYNEAIPLAQAEGGVNSSNVGNLLESLAKCYYRAADYANAEQTCKRALDIHERTAGPNSIESANVMNNLAIFYKVQSRYTESEALFQKTLDIRERNLGPDDPKVAETLSNLANVLLALAKYSDAEKDYQRALEITERSKGEDDPKVATYLNNLAALYHMLGRFDEEEPLYRRALEIMTKAYGPDHEDVAQATNNLAYMFHDMGKYADAEPLYQQALTIEQKTQGMEHPKVSATLGNLARLHTDEKKYDTAELFARQALAIGEKTQGQDHTDVAEILKTLGDLLQLQGRSAEADASYQRALAILEKRVGKTHPLEAGVLFGMAMLAKQGGDFAKAKEYETRAYSIRRAKFSEGFAVMAEPAALDYSRFFQEEAANYLSVLLDAPDGEKVNSTEIARVVLSTKGQVSDGIFARHKSVSAIAALSDSFSQASQVVSLLYVRGPDPARAWAYNAEVSRANQRKAEFESELARQSGEMRNEKMLTDVEVGKVSALLLPGSALIDIIRYQHRLSLRETENRYLAILIKGGSKPFVFPLGTVASIDSAVAKYRDYFQNPARSDLNRANYVAASGDVYRDVWQPIAPLLYNVDAIFLAPDGMLGLVSFAGLLDDQGSYLIEKHTFHYLLTGRDILRPLDISPHGKGLLALADPDYDATPASRIGGGSSKLMTGIQSVLATMTPRNVTSGCRALRDMRVSRLPGTRVEIERLAKEWTDVRSEPVITYLDAKASEENLKRECHGKRIVHLATHGYFISEECRPDHAGAGFVGESPLLQSGVFLAGANLKGQGAAEVGADDGIVTAEEVANLNLQGTQLVILSACETGIGDVHTGEGVFGLRRAFQMAGGQTVISALWSVDDESAAEIIGRLFAEGNGTIAEIMRSAALKRIAALRAAGKSDDPFFWAPFISTGEWRYR